MEFSEVIAARHSVRDFTGESVSEKLIEEVVRDAQTAPSWLNAQEWRVYAATGETLANFKREFYARASGGEQGASDFAVASRTTWSKMAQENMANVVEDIKNHLNGDMGGFEKPQDTLFNAPALLFMTVPKNCLQWAVLDLGGFCQTLMLAATARGLGSIPAYAIVKYPDLVRKYLGASEDEAVAMGIALGYASDAKINSFRSARADVKSILTIKK